MYATLSDLVERFGEAELIQLTDTTGAGEIDESRAAAALEDAHAEVHGYLATRYPQPPDPVPRLLVRVAADIARYHLYDDAAPDEVRRRCEDARRVLQAIARGEVSLGAPHNTPTHALTVTLAGQPPRLFARRRGGGLR